MMIHRLARCTLLANTTILNAGYSVPKGMKALFQPDGGFLCPEKIIQVCVWKG